MFIVQMKQVALKNDFFELDLTEQKRQSIVRSKTNEPIHTHSQSKRLNQNRA